MSHSVDPSNTQKPALKRQASAAALQRRKLARSLEIKPSDLGALGKLRFYGFAKAEGAVNLVEKWMAEHPDKIINKDGQVAPVFDIYLRTLNTRARALDGLEEFIREDLKSPEQEMRELLAKSDH